MPKRKHSGKEEEDIMEAKEINIVKLAEARAAEIQALYNDVSFKSGNRQMSQTLPPHMRRRAMSHNIKRLPRRMREFAKKEYDKIDKTAVKRPSRKHRRRPKNLLAEYTRRQRNNCWLETHIWHAKRFFIENKWGYRIPINPTDKSLRAAYRATKQHCIIQDISYMCCIEIAGHQDKILEGLNHMTSPDTGPTFGAKSCLSGTREGKVILYSCDRYPYSCICPASFLWKPCLGNILLSSEKRQLWLWVHPSCYEEVWEQLKMSFKYSDNCKPRSLETEEEIVPMDTGNSKTDNVDSPKTTDIKASSSSNTNLLSREFVTGDITVRSLKDSLVRFRLSGPESHAVVAGALEVADIMSSTEESRHWWHTYYRNEDATLGFSQQREFWENTLICRCAAELPPHCVLGLVVGDPRLRIPETKTKASDRRQDTGTCHDLVSPDMSLSAIWEEPVRLEVTSSKTTDSQLNKMKNEDLLPGTPLQLGVAASKIPLLLIQRPGVQQGSQCGGMENYGCGWDLILPSGWSMAFWVALIYQGARAGGLRELENLSVEQRRFHFPNDFSDSKAGQIYEEHAFDNLSKKFDRKPPSKRPNFVKLGIVSPFKFPWETIIQEWNTNSLGSFYVLRSRQDLSQLSKPLSSVQLFKHTSKDQCKSAILSDNKFMKYESSLKSILHRHKNSLISVHIEMVGRGAPVQYANIAIPGPEDLLKLVEDKGHGGPIEPNHQDLTKKAKTDHITSCKTSESNLIKSCSRTIIGYVKQGGLSLSVGQGRGIGYIALTGLFELLKTTPSKMPCIVLVRDPTSFQYRFAYLNISDSNTLC